MIQWWRDSLLTLYAAYQILFDELGPYTSGRGSRRSPIAGLVMGRPKDRPLIGGMMQLNV